MLFFYGIGSSTRGPFALPGLACAHCHTLDALAIVIVTRYFHFFWIPVFPFQKKAVSVCAHCQQALAQREWPAAYQGPGLAIKQQTSLPLTNFAGLLIIGLLVLVGAFTSCFN